MTPTTVNERIPLSRADRARRADAMQVRETERYHGAASDRWTDGVSRSDLVALRSAISRGCPVPGDVRRAIAAAVVEALDAGLRDRKTLSLVKTFLLAMQEAGRVR